MLIIIVISLGLYQVLQNIICRTCMIIIDDHYHSRFHGWPSGYYQPSSAEPYIIHGHYHFHYHVFPSGCHNLQQCIIIIVIIIIMTIFQVASNHPLQHLPCTSLSFMVIIIAIIMVVLRASIIQNLLHLHHYPQAWS